MMRRLMILLALLLPAAAAAQLLPPVGQLPAGLPTVGDVTGRLGDALAPVEQLPRSLVRLANDRLARIDALVRAHPDTIARDDHGDPARAGEVVVTDPDAALIDAAGAAGFTLIERATIEGVDIGYARFRTPPGKSLPAALKAMRKLAGKREVSADQLHFESGAVGLTAKPLPFRGGVGLGYGDQRHARMHAPTPNPSPKGEGLDRASPRLGIIDGGVSATAGLAGDITRAGFAKGAGGGSNHGTAVASLIVGTPTIRGAATGAQLWAADVYGTDPAGGNATAIARALGWLVGEQVPVVVISLVGPANPLLARVVAAARAKGTIVVAAVGNDGPAAPPSYPASYPGVIAVTGVDAKDRALIEAGRALHLDYSAPGADMLASDANGRAVPVRGTSFAAPLVAALFAKRYDRPAPAALGPVLHALDSAARDLGKPGPDPRYGRGLLCESCRTALK